MSAHHFGIVAPQHRPAQAGEVTRPEVCTIFSAPGKMFDFQRNLGRGGMG
jgi:hypothetical protein